MTARKSNRSNRSIRCPSGQVQGNSLGSAYSWMPRPIEVVCGATRGILAVCALALVAALPPNAYAAAPTVVGTGIADQMATEDAAAVTLDVAGSFTDSDGDTLTYAATLDDGTALPSFISLSGSTLTFTPTHSDQGGVHSIKVTASDAADSVSDTFDLTVTAVNDVSVTDYYLFPGRASFLNLVEDAPVIIDLSEHVYDEDSELTFSLVRASLNAVPEWASLEGSTLTLAPSRDDHAGTYSIGIEVTGLTDAMGVDGETIDFALATAVTAVDDPILVTTPVADIPVGTTDVGLAGVFTDEEGASLTFTAMSYDGTTESALPSWITLSGSTLTLTPTATEIGTYRLLLTASDGADTPQTASLDQVFTIVAAASFPVVAATIANQEVIEDEPAVTFSVVAPAASPTTPYFTDDGGASGLTYSVTLGGGGALPAFITFDSSTNNLTFAPTHIDEQGTYTLVVTATDADSLTASQSFGLKVTEVDDAPVLVTAIADQMATEDATAVTLDVSFNFSDEENVVLAYAATLDDGTALPSFITLTDSTGTFAGSTFTFAPTLSSQAGTYSIVVTASDIHASVSDTFDLTVTAVDDPILVTTPVTTTQAGTTLVVDLAEVFTDEEGATLTFTAMSYDGTTETALPSWIALSGSTLTFTPSTTEVGTYRLLLAASDGAATPQTASLDQVFTILMANTTPTVVTAIVDQSVTEDATAATLDVAASFTDSDGDTLTYAATLDDGTALPSFITLSGSEFTFAPTLSSEGGVYSIKVTASDAADSVSDTFDLTVTAVNDDPVVVTAIADQTATEDATAATLDVSSNFSDEETGALALSAALSDASALPSFITLSGSTFTFAPTLSSEAGTYSIEVTASDASVSVSDTFDLTVTAVDDAIVATAPDATLEAGTTLVVDLADVFTDEEGATLTFTAMSYDGTTETALPSWIALSGSDLTFTPTETEVGTYRLLLAASDGADTPQTASLDQEFTILTGNAPPTVVTAIADQVATEDATAVTLDVAASFTDGDGDTLTYAATLDDDTALPSFITFSGSEFTFAPTHSDHAGTHSIKVTASDTYASVSDTFALTVTAVNDPSEIDLNDKPGSGTDIALTEDAAATVIDLADYVYDEETDLTYSLIDSPPEWASIAGSMLTLAPTHSDDASQEILAVNTHGLTDAMGEARSNFIFYLDVDVTAVNDSPIVATTPETSIFEGFATVVDLAEVFTDEETAALTFTAMSYDGTTESALPSWIALSGSDLTLTPSVTELGTYRLLVTASDDDDTPKTASLDLVFTIEVNPAPYARAAIPDQAVTEDEPAVILNLVAPAESTGVPYFTDDGGLNNLTFAVALDGGDPLPDFITFDNATNDLTFAPTHSDHAGTYTLAVTATDADNNSGSQSFDLVVTAVDDPVEIVVTNADGEPLSDQSLIQLVPNSRFAPDDADATQDVRIVLVDEELEAGLEAELVWDCCAPAMESEYGVTSLDGVEYSSLHLSFTPTEEDEEVRQLQVNALDASDNEVGSGSLVVRVYRDPVVPREVAQQDVLEDTPSTLDLTEVFVMLNQALEYTVEVVNPSGGIEAVPSWIELDSGTVTFAPSLDEHAGNYRIEAVAGYSIDAAGGDTTVRLESTVEFDLTVTAVNDPPVVNVAGIPGVIINGVGTALALTEDAAATVIDLSDYIYDEDSEVAFSLLNITEALPEWASLEGSILTLAPSHNDHAGQSAIGIRAAGFTSTSTGTDGDFIAFNLDTTVTAADDPIIVTAPETAIPEDSTFVVDLNAVFSDEEVAALTFTAMSYDGTTETALPSWIALSGTTLTFTPDATEVGTYRLLLTASDGNTTPQTASLDQEFTIGAVNDVPVLAVTLVTAPSGIIPADIPVATLSATDEEDSSNFAFVLSEPGQFRVVSGAGTTADPYVDGVTKTGTGPYTFTATVVTSRTIELAPSTTLTVMAVDDGGAAHSVTQNLDVAIAPVADAGADQFVMTGDTVMLDASGSQTCPSCTSLVYAWTVVSSASDITITDDTTAAASFTAPDSVQEITVMLTVSDSGDALFVDTDEVRIVVRSAMHNALNSQIAMQQAALSFQDVNRSIVDQMSLSFARAESPSDSGGITAERLAGYLARNGERLEEEGLWGLLSTQGFSSSTVRGDGLPVSIWIRGAVHDMSYAADAAAATNLNYDGDLRNLQLGVDSFIGENVLAGMVLSDSSGEFDYGADSTFGSSYDSDHLGVHPWLGWKMGSFNAWVVLSFGSGEVNIQDANSTGLNVSSDTESQSQNVGLSVDLASWFRLRYESEQSDFEVLGSQLVQAMRTETAQTRFSVELSKTYADKAGSKWVPQIRYTVRDRTDDLVSGDVILSSSTDYSGSELDLKLLYHSAVAGVTVELGLRSLEADLVGYEELGSYVLVQVDPGISNRGLAFSLRPSYGDLSDKSDALWNDSIEDLSSLSAGTQRDESRLVAELSYPVGWGNWLIRPYTSLDSTSRYATSEWGARLELSSMIELALVSETIQGQTGDDQRLNFEGRIRF